MREIQTAFFFAVFVAVLSGCADSVDGGDCPDGKVCGSGLTLIKDAESEHWSAVPSEELNACTEQEECASVETSCADCCMPDAVNEKKEDDYLTGKAALCSDWSGEACDCDWPSGTPKCVDGQCRYVLDESPGLCGDLSFDPGYADECKANICVSRGPISVVRDADGNGLQCVGPGGSDTCAASAGELQQYRFENDDLYIHLRFTSDIVGNYSTDRFRESFHSGTATAKFEVDGKVATDSFNLDSFEGEYSEGKIVFKLNHTIEHLYYNLHSNHPDCISDDIAGMCACYYDTSFEIEYLVSLDIPTE